MSSPIGRGAAPAPDLLARCPSGDPVLSVGRATMSGVTYPTYPSPAGPGNDGSQPGWYPLRPLSVGELLGAGLRIAVRHLAVLAPIAFVFTIVASAGNLLVLSAKGALRSYASGDLFRVTAGASDEQARQSLHALLVDLLPAVAASAAISAVAAPFLAGVTVPFAALAATSRTGTTAAGLVRLRGRWPVLLGVAVVVALAELLGYVLLIVPGFFVMVMLLPAGPVAAMEGLGVTATLRRARTLSKGFKGRLFGVTLLITLIVGVIGLVLNGILTRVVGGDDPVTRLVITQLLNALVSAVLTPWSSAVIALLYIDIRIRREGLAQALLAASRPSYWS